MKNFQVYYGQKKKYYPTNLKIALLNNLEMELEPFNTRPTNLVSTRLMCIRIKRERTCLGLDLYQFAGVNVIQHYNMEFLI